MTNLASGDGEGDVEIAVHFLLGFLNRHLVGPLLELHILHADRGGDMYLSRKTNDDTLQSGSR